MVFTLFLVLLLTDINNLISYIAAAKAILSPVILILSIFLILNKKSPSLRKVLRSKQVRYFMLAFFGYLILGTIPKIFTGELPQALDAYRLLLPSMVIFIAAVIGFTTMIEKSGLWYTINLVRILLLLNIVFLVVSYSLGLNFMGELEKNRFTGVFTNPNQAAFMACLLWGIELYILQIRRHIFSAFVLGITLVGLVLAASKAGFIIAALTLLMNLTTGNIRKRFTFFNRFVVYFAVIGLVGMVAFRGQLEDIFSNEERNKRLLQTFAVVQGELNEETTTNRNLLLNEGIRRIKANPIAGDGLLEFALLDGYQSGVHNQVILIWGDAGIFAVFLYISYFVHIFFRSKPAGERNALLFRALALIAFTYGMTNHNMYVNKSWIIMVAFSGTVFFFMYKQRRDQYLQRESEDVDQSSASHEAVPA